MDMGVIKCLKHHYKNELQSRKVSALNLGLEAPNISILDSLFILKKVWLQKVSNATIINCFRKAGFRKEENCDEDIVDEEEDAHYEEINFEDDDVPTFDLEAPLVFQDENINERENEEEISEEDELNYIPKSSEAFNAANVLRQYFCAHGSDEFSSMADDMQNAIGRIVQNSMTQKLVTDYFIFQ